MKFKGPVIVVDNMAVSKQFYETLLNQKAVMDLGGNITFADGFSIQLKLFWLDFIDKRPEDLREKENNFELYFETVDFDGFLKKLETFDLEYVTPLTTYPWHQRVVRFYDPDKHIVEVGESMAAIARRFLEEGLSAEDVSKTIQHPVEFVLAAKQEEI